MTWTSPFITGLEALVALGVAAAASALPPDWESLGTVGVVLVAVVVLHRLHLEALRKVEDIVKAQAHAQAVTHEASVKRLADLLEKCLDKDGEGER